MGSLGFQSYISKQQNKKEVLELLEAACHCLARTSSNKDLYLKNLRIIRHIIPKLKSCINNCTAFLDIFKSHELRLSAISNIEQRTNISITLCLLQISLETIDEACVWKFITGDGHHTSLVESLNLYLIRRWDDQSFDIVNVRSGFFST